MGKKLTVAPIYWLPVLQRLNNSGLEVVGRVEAKLIFESVKYDVTLRVVPDKAGCKIL